MFSAKIERTRFLRAIGRPVVAQKRSSSGCQSSIQRPRRSAAEAAAGRAWPPSGRRRAHARHAESADPSGLYDIGRKFAGRFPSGRSKVNRAVHEHAVAVARPTPTSTPRGSPTPSRRTACTAPRRPRSRRRSGWPSRRSTPTARSKEALFLLAVEAEVERVLDRLAAAERSPPGARRRAQAAARALLDHAAARPRGARLLWRTAHHGGSSVGDATSPRCAGSPTASRPRCAATSPRRASTPSSPGGSPAPWWGAAAGLADARAGERRPSRARSPRSRPRSSRRPPAVRRALGAPPDRPLRPGITPCG